MRRFKIIVWTFIIFLIQTVIISQIHVLGAVPSIALSYIMCVVIMENEFRNAAMLSLICAAAAGALGGRDFIIMTLCYAYGSLVVFTLRKKPMHIGNFTKAFMWTFIVSAVSELVYFLAAEWSLDLGTLLYDALPTAAINALLTAIVYPVLKRTMYREEKKKQLIV